VANRRSIINSADFTILYNIIERVGAPRVYVRVISKHLPLRIYQCVDAKYMYYHKLWCRVRVLWQLLDFTKSDIILVRDNCGGRCRWKRNRTFLQTEMNDAKFRAPCSRISYNTRIIGKYTVQGGSFLKGKPSRLEKLSLFLEMFSLDSLHNNIIINVFQRIFLFSITFEVFYWVVWMTAQYCVFGFKFRSGLLF